MSDVLVSAVEIAALFAAATIIASVISAALYPAFRRGIAAARPAVRSLASLAFGLTAPAAGAVVALVAVHPALAGLMVPAHCHDGACGSHAPVIDSLSLGGMALAVCASLVVIGGAAAGLYGLALARRRLAMLRSFGRRDARGRYLVVETAERVAWCCGLVFTRTFVSRGLIDALSPRQLDAVLAHERAHGERLDNLRAVVLQWATVFWPEALRKRTRSDLADDNEQACDADALGTMGNRSLLASVIETLSPCPAAATRGTAFSVGDTRARVAALARPQAEYRHPLTVCLLLLGVWLFEVPLVTAVTHGLVEWIAALG